MSENGLSEIIELQECGVRFANFYLDSGYQLLYVDTLTRPAILPTHEKKPGFPYARRGPVYVMGRTATVAHVDRPETVT